eukprot:gb/GFBE01037139.1/.p1 GENE.gb/GFBE01037139.1/~~gb/GFBE01037139.1/.p1  ORF type:complete len:348 (+),score=59.96 gb/GFBE01037139.1/:1-1044(+)
MVVVHLMKWSWNQWWIMTLLWYVCAILVVVAVKQATHKSMLTFCSNLLVGWPLVAPFALRQGLRNLRAHLRQVVVIAVLAALERNLTNSALYKIGGSLKTALHGFNVVFTFFVAALIGADEVGRRCIVHRACGDNLLLTLAITLVAGGSVVTALVGDGKEGGKWSGDALGVSLQLGASLAYAFKFAAAKLLFSSGHGESGTAVTADAGPQPPSKLQIAFIVNPVTGLMGLAFLPFFETSYELPPFGVILAVALCATGILVFELRLTELTSPLTVSVLAVLHNVVIVVFFGLLGESMSDGQILGFAISTLGAGCYALARKRQATARPLLTTREEEMRRSVGGDEPMEL